MKIAITILATILFSLSILFAIPKHSFSTAPVGLNKKVYQCLPCGRNCDKQTYSKPGKCSECQMDLVKKSTVTFKSLEPSELCRYISLNKKVILLDVRTKEEFEEKANPNLGVLKNAINIPIQELQSRLATLNSYKNQEILSLLQKVH